ncbi:MAG: hypothetical protein JNK05_36320 [Myxococcales bacterium]|nr:hypothetical protein [Myxococcales bacterium]
MTQDLDTLSDADLATVEAEAIADWFVAIRRAAVIAQRVANVHPALRDPAGRRQIIARLLRSNQTAARPEETLLTTLLLRSATDPLAVPLALEIATSASEVARAALEVLFEQAHAETLARLDSELEQAITSRPPTWAPGHATEWIAHSIRAAFMRAGDRASERFAAHFSAEALATEAGPQVAASILRIGAGFVARPHAPQDVPKAPMVSADPRFFAIVARLLGHSQLESLARDVLKLLSPAERKAVIGATPAGAFAAPAKPKKKPKKPWYQAGDRVRHFRSGLDWRGTPVTIARVHPSGDIEIAREDGLRSALISPSSFAALVEGTG